MGSVDVGVLASRYCVCGCVDVCVLCGCIDYLNFGSLDNL